MTDVVQVYVRLLDEGTDVFRPTTGTVNTDGSIELHKTADYDPEDKKWEFLPGSRVLAEKRKLSGDEVLVAFRVRPGVS